MVKAAKPIRRRALDPSPEEIRARAETIRESWTERERTKRAIWSPPPWLPPAMGPIPDAPLWYEE